MNKIGQKFSDKLKYLFLSGACLALINTFSRADYNFVLYLYMYYIWIYITNDLEIQTREKITSFYILFYSLFIDIIWCFFWKSQWGYLKEDIESGTHGFVIFFSWIGIFLKIFIFIVIAVTEKNIIKGTLPKALGEKLNSRGYLPQVDDDIRDEQ